MSAGMGALKCEEECEMSEMVCRKHSVKELVVVRGGEGVSKEWKHGSVEGKKQSIEVGECYVYEVIVGE